MPSILNHIAAPAFIVYMESNYNKIMMCEREWDEVPPPSTHAHLHNGKVLRGQTLCMQNGVWPCKTKWTGAWMQHWLQIKKKVEKQELQLEE